MKNITTNNLRTAVIILAALLTVACLYILFEKLDICETARNDSYNAGSQQGVLFWNSVVIKTVNEQGEIPYIFNNTLQSIPISQFYEGVQNG